MPDMFKNGSNKETVTIQTTGQRGEPEALDRDHPQTKQGLAPLINFSTQVLIINEEPPWLWFTLQELGFPLLADEYRRPIHPEIEEYMRRYVSNDQDWEKVDDEDC